MPATRLHFSDSLGPEQITDLRLAASKMTGATRRAFEAEMALKYCRNYSGPKIVAKQGLFSLSSVP